MDFKSLIDINKNFTEEFYDLSTPNLIYRTDVSFSEYTVEQGDDMRIDLIFKKMYALEPNEVDTVIQNIDIILFINNIDNPLDIMKGQILIYPSLKDFDKFRRDEEQLEESRVSIKEKLTVPNKSTKKDSNRLKYIEQDYSLPPVVLRNPKQPVRLDGNKMSIGGL